MSSLTFGKRLPTLKNKIPQQNNNVITPLCLTNTHCFSFSLSHTHTRNIQNKQTSTYIAQCDKWKTKRLHLIPGIFIVKNHAVRRQIDPALLFAPECALLGPRELNIHMFRIQQNTVIGGNSTVIHQFCRHSVW